MSHIKDKAAFELKQRGYEVDECICGWPKPTTELRCSKCTHTSEDDKKEMEKAAKKVHFIRIRALYCPFGIGVRKAESVCREKGCALWDHDGDQCYFITGVKWLGELAVNEHVERVSADITFEDDEGTVVAKTWIKGCEYVGRGSNKAKAKASLMAYIEGLRQEGEL